MKNFSTKNLLALIMLIMVIQSNLVAQVYHKIDTSLTSRTITLLKTGPTLYISSNPLDGLTYKGRTFNNATTPFASMPINNIGTNGVITSFPDSSTTEETLGLSQVKYLFNSASIFPNDTLKDKIHIISTIYDINNDFVSNNSNFNYNNICDTNIINTVKADSQLLLSTYTPGFIINPNTFPQHIDSVELYEGLHTTTLSSLINAPYNDASSNTITDKLTSWKSLVKPFVSNSEFSWVGVGAPTGTPSSFNQDVTIGNVTNGVGINISGYLDFGSSFWLPVPVADKQLYINIVDSCNFKTKDTTVCKGAIFNLNLLKSDTTGVVYTGPGVVNNIFNSSTLNNGIYVIKSTNTYTNGTCQDSIIIRVNYADTSINSNGFVGCESTINRSTHTVSAAPGQDAYEWYVDGVASGITTQSITFANPINALVKCLVTNGICSGFTKEIRIIINPAPANSINATYIGNDVRLCAASNTNYNYAWYKDNTLIVDSTSNCIIVSVAGLYHVIVTDTTTGCVNESSKISVVIALPLHFYYIKSICENNKTVLKWKASSELGNKFMVQKSYNGQTFTNVKEYIVSNDNAIEYTYIESTTSTENVYYKILHSEPNKITTSETIRGVNCNTQKENTISIYPNPSADKINISLNKGYYTLKVLDAVGKTVIYYKIDNITSTNKEVSLKQFGSGVYYIEITNIKTNIKTAKKVIII